MPRAESAGLLMYRHRNGRLEVLLAHPGGPFWAKRDLGAWSIPKGEIEPGEDPLQAAIREFREETGHEAAGSFLFLQPVRQAGGKLVHAWAFEGDLDPAAIISGTFTMQWPPRSGTIAEFPEVDRVEWFPLDAAFERILKGQQPLLMELRQLLESNS